MMWKAHSKKMQKHVASINSLVACLESGRWSKLLGFKVTRDHNFAAAECRVACQPDTQISRPITRRRQAFFGFAAWESLLYAWGKYVALEFWCAARFAQNEWKWLLLSYCCLIVEELSFYSLFASGLEYTASKWKCLSRAQLPHISFVILQEDESIHHLADSIDILDRHRFNQLFFLMRILRHVTTISTCHWHLPWPACHSHAVDYLDSIAMFRFRCHLLTYWYLIDI